MHKIGTWDIFSAFEKKLIVFYGFFYKLDTPIRSIFMRVHWNPTFRLD